MNHSDIDADVLLADLTPEQSLAVQHVDGPLLIIAGAGSGKTRVITRRVAHLVAQGISPWSILAITFTNKAAGEMKQRIAAALGRPLRDFGQLHQSWPMVCTFHSLCLRILRHYAGQIGLPSNFSIYDSADQTRLIKEALKVAEISSTNFPPSMVHATISNAKNKLLTPEAFAETARDFSGKVVARVYSRYQKLLQQSNALDFDDLLMRTAHSLRDHKQILPELQERFGHILIDEYQDTNHAQYVLAHALALARRNICVVGDPDQSIYAWRGADIQNILDFEKDYADAKVIRLERNYRSTKTILAIASKLIDQNHLRKKKSLWTENAEGEKAEVYICQSERDEARVVTERFMYLHEKEKTPWSQMAVFYRINALSRVMEDALRRANVPYQIARGVEFYGRKEIKDMLAYLRVIANPEDQVSLERIINVPPRGIGEGSVKKMEVYALAHGLTLQAVMQQAHLIDGLSTRAVTAIGKFITLLERWRKSPALTAGPDPETQPDMPLFGTRVSSLMESVLRDSGLEALHKKAANEGSGDAAALANVAELISAGAEFDQTSPTGTLIDYLAQVSLVSDTDHLADGGGAVTLMTLHAAKGLEFGVVAMIGMEEGLLPHSRARGNPAEMEEERRLCFVGITRAQQRLVLSQARTRVIRGITERTIASPFFRELPAENLNITERNASPFDGSDGRDEICDSQFRPGQRVRHAMYGAGVIVDMAGVGRHARVMIDFPQVGRKTFVLESAPLEAV